MDVYTRNLAQSVVLLDQRPETRIYLGSLKDGIVTLEDVQNIPNSNQSRRNGKLNRVADRRAALARHKAERLHDTMINCWVQATIW